MGTKGGKPISSIEKKQKKVEKKIEKKEVKEEKKETKPGAIELSMIRKVLEELKGQSYLTPFQVAQKYSMKYSMAKKLLKAVVSQGDAGIVAKNRRVIVISLRR